jgi:ribokinase
MPGAGETLPDCEFARANGGKGANQAVACARLGAKTAMVGRVGTDEFAATLLADLERDGIDITNVSTDSAARTGVALILVDASAENRIMISAGSNNALTPAHVDEAGSLIDGADLLLVQLEVPAETTQRAVDRATAAGVRVLLNPAPANAISTLSWSRIDYLVPNETEASQLSGIQVTNVRSASVAARSLMQRGVRHVLITLGAQGVLIGDADGIRSHVPPEVHALDTTAAGDTFIGGLAAALIKGADLDTAAKFAVTAAALSVTRTGAQPSIPYHDQVQQLLSKKP